MEKTNSLNRLSGACGVAMILVATTWAATHVVRFGGSAGFRYVPSSFSAAVGDTVRWEGDFSVHPLSSTTIPSGSQSWHVSSGSSFSYVIPVTGAYHYKCDLHTGMTGDFQAGATGISSPVRQIEPQTTPAVIQIIDLAGRERAALRNGGTGENGQSLSTTASPGNGVYCIRFNKKKTAKIIKIK